MHILTANIIKTVTDEANITIHVKYVVKCGLLINILLTLAYFKLQGQGYVQFDYEYL